MSLFQNKHLHVLICPDGVGIARLAGWRRPRLEFVHEIALGNADFMACLDALDAWLAENPQTKTGVSFVLSAAYVRAAMLPWMGAGARDDEQLALMAARFEEQFGDMQEWLMQADQAPAFATPALAFAIPRALHAGLSALCEKHLLRAGRVVPYAVASWNKYKRLCRGEQCLFAVADGAHLTMLTIKSQEGEGVLTAIRSVTLSSDGHVGGDEIEKILRREMLLQGFEMAPQILLDAPQAAAGLSLSADIDIAAQTATEQVLAAMALRGAGS